MKYLAFLVLIVIVLILANGKGMTSSPSGYTGPNTAHKTMKSQISQYKKVMSQYNSKYASEYKSRIDYKANRYNAPYKSSYSYPTTFTLTSYSSAFQR